MNKNIILVIFPGLIVMAITVFSALGGWGRRDTDFALVLFVAAFFFGLATSIAYRSLKQTRSNKESSLGEFQGTTRLKNRLFHIKFSAGSLFAITCSFLIYESIKDTIETEACRVYMCAELVNYDAQYPMHKDPAELFLLAQQTPLDIDYITGVILPNLELEGQYLDDLDENRSAKSLRCSRDVYRLDGAMKTLVHYKEVWLENLLEKNNEAPQHHYSQQGALDEHKGVNKYRAALSCD